MQNDNVRKYRGFTKTTSTENKQGRGTRKTKFQKGNYKYEKNTNKRERRKWETGRYTEKTAKSTELKVQKSKRLPTTALTNCL